MNIDENNKEYISKLLISSIEHPIATLSKQDIEKIINRNNSQTKEKGGELLSTFYF